MSVNVVLVAGAGVAGVTAVETLRKEGYEGRLVLAGAEPELPYRRPPLSKELLRGERTADAVRLRPQSWYADHDVELLTGTSVTDVDAAARTATLSDGGRLTWDRLVLATGGRPRRLPCTTPGDGTLHLRELADLPALEAALQPGRRLAVVGGGFVGAEVAASARHRGCEVVLLEAAPLPLARLLPPVVARALVGLQRDAGVDVRLGAQVERVRHTPGGSVLHLADGTEVAADAVLVGVGMEPSTALARAAGCAVGTGPADGVLVDAAGWTSVPGVLAAGDLACRPDARTGRPSRSEHWSAAQAGGATAARALLGRAPGGPEVPWSWSDQHGVNVQVCGWPDAADEVVVRGDLAARDATVLLGAGGRLTAGVTVGRPREGRTVRALLAAGTRWSEVADPEAELPAA